MQSHQGLIPAGFLTLSCEGNNNPYSANWSRRLRIGHKGHIIIGKGYNLTTSGEKQSLLDFTEAGVPKPKAQLLAKAANLSSFEVNKFIAFYKTEIVLTKDQEQKLFEIKHKKAEAILRTKLDIYLKKNGYISTYNVVPYQWEILVDIIYRGDLSSSNERHIFTALNTALKERDARIFDRAILDVNYWRQMEVPEDRIKMRCIFMNEWNSFSDQHQTPVQEQTDEESVTPMLLKFPDLFSIEGFFVDLRRDSLHFVLKRSFVHPNAKNMQMLSGVSLEELIIALKLCYDRAIDATIIGGTLKPLALNNSEEKRMKKEFYPDYYHNKQIIAGTKFSEIISEAAKIVTQIASGHAIVEKGGYFEKEGEFEHLQAFREIGIVPLENIKGKGETKEFISQKSIRSISPNMRLNGSFQTLQPLKTIILQSADQESKLIRLWLVVKNAKEIHISNEEGEYYSASEVRLGLKPCRINITPQGAWEETTIEDPHDPAYIFAQKFTDKYNLISKLFPAFKKVEQMCKAILLANWMHKKSIPVDMSMIDNYYQKGLQYISSPTKTIFKEQGGVSSPEVRQNTATQSSMSLSPTKKRPSTRSNTFYFSKSSLSQINSPEHSPVNMKNSRSPDARGMSFSSMVVTKSNNNAYAIFGGVLFDMEQGRSSEKNATLSGLFDSQPKHSEEHFDMLFQGKIQIDYPFQHAICKVCENYLKYSEIMSSAKGESYCRLHHPFSCEHCYNVIKSDCLEVEGKRYHSTCIICRHCERIIHGKLLKIEQGFLHVQCSEEFMKGLAASVKRNAHSSLSPSRGRGNPKKSIVSFKL